jgi:vitamin B12 transporter
MKHIILLVLCFMASKILLSQQSRKIEQLDSVKIDTKTLLPRKQSGKIIYKITSEELENSRGMSVAEVVNRVSGIEINGSKGNEGQNLGYYVRGGRNRQVVVMVDGIQLNDPSQIASDFDLRLIPATIIESIEIIKGASSVLYGSGAATAVISIATKKASEAPISAVFSSTYGTNSSSENKDTDIEEFTNHVALNGTVNHFFYNVNFSNRFTEGLSAIAAPDGEEKFEEDIFNRYNGSIKLGYNFNKHLQLSRFFSLDNYKAGFDDFSYTDADYETASRQKRTGGSLQWKYRKGSLIINDNYTWIEREINSSFPAKYDAEAFTFDAFASYRFVKALQAIVGLNGNFSSFNSYTIPFGSTEFNQDVNDDLARHSIIDPYVTLLYVSEFGFNINAGARLNIHSDYGNHVVYNVNPSYSINFGNNSLKLLSSYSTAYITPSLFQLYDPSYGNEMLLPEENTTLEGGFEFTSENDLRFSALYFKRNETNYVDFVNVDPMLFLYQYQNIDEKFEASGVEVEISKKFAEKVTASANYTNTRADERFALRIPEHKINVSLGCQVFETTRLGLNYQFNSNRDDSFFNPVTFESEAITLGSYSLLDLNLSHQLTKSINLFAAMSNVLNQEYQELYRFQTRGRNIRAGFTIEL